jgi:2-aminomuconate deaminase
VNLVAQQEILKSTTAPRPMGAYPHARRFGELLFLSGIGPRSAADNSVPGRMVGPDGREVSHDIRMQTRATIENVRRILEEAGSSLSKVVDITVFLTDMAGDFAAYNEVYAEYFQDIQPTRTTVGVTALPSPIAVEFKVIAAA